jgi:sulfofructose kinase
MDGGPGVPGKRIVAVGIAVMDKIFGVARIPTEPIKVFASDYAEIGGGPAATGAVTIARLGGSAELWARVGNDPVGARIIAELREWGVAPHVRTIPGARSNVSGVLVDEAGERMIASFTDPSLDPDPTWLPLDRVAGADAVLADIRWPVGSEAVLRHARKAGIPTVLDVDLAPDDVIRTLLPLPDYAIFSQPALCGIVGVQDLAEALAGAQGLCRGKVGVTAGEDGFWWLDDGVVRHAPGFRVSVRDTLGAGDVFHGAFALGIASGWSMAETARFANAASALKCMRAGGRAGIPSRAELDVFLAERTTAAAMDGSGPPIVFRSRADI